MGNKISVGDLARAYNCGPGSVSYLIIQANTKMVRGMAEKMNIPLYHALRLYADFVDEPAEEMYQQIDERLQQAIKQEVLSGREHK